MAEYRREITIGSVLAVLVIVALALAVVYVPLTDDGSSPVRSAGNSSSTAVLTQETTGASTEILATTEDIPANFSLAGNAPYLTASPRNDTFVLTYKVTAYNYNLSLAYNQMSSYAVQYSNGTEWLNTSKSCQTTEATNTTATNTTSYASTVATTTGIPCGSLNGEWYPVNGAAVLPHIDFNASNVKLSIQPNSIPAHTTEQVQFTVSFDMSPGVYAIDLAMDVRTQGSPQAVQCLLGYTPLVVEA